MQSTMDDYKVRCALEPGRGRDVRPVRGVGQRALQNDGVKAFVGSRERASTGRLELVRRRDRDHHERV